MVAVPIHVPEETVEEQVEGMSDHVDPNTNDDGTGIGFEMNPPESDIQKCDECLQEPPVYYCGNCRASFCEDCWPGRGPHRRQNPLHQQVSYGQYRIFGHILNPQWTEDVRQQQHNRELNALWFSVDQRDGVELELEEFPRFSHIMAEHRHTLAKEVPSSASYPRLASFIGTSGAGKSTIIRTLMEGPWDEANRASNKERLQHLALPVVGRAGSSNPTSGDVHLYCDPVPDKDDYWRPLLYADCEGFRGGSQLPAALRARQNVAETSRRSISFNIPEYERWARLGFAYIKHGFKRVLRLPSRLDPVRHSAVAELFPRLMYNFSDVVVHVTFSVAVKTLEEDIVKLLEWAQASQAAAVNRATLPHLIIILNISESTTWDPVTTTAAIFLEQQRALSENPILAKEKRRLERLGARIDTLEDLMEFSYASVQFIRLPKGGEGGDPARFSTQLQRLHGLMHAATVAAQERKKAAKMLLCSPDQDMFFKLAFDHYSENLDKPFDFLGKLMSLHPLPNTLENNFFHLMQAVKQACAGASTDISGEKFCAIVTPILCSTIALDACRTYTHLPGTLEDVFKGDMVPGEASGPVSTVNTYETQVAHALREFFDIACPCEFVDSSGRRCVNSLRMHGAIYSHQDSEGLFFGIGGWESSFMEGVMRKFIPLIRGHLRDLDGIFENSNVLSTATGSSQSRLHTTWLVHEANLQKLFQAIPTLRLSNLFTCFWCFRKSPTEILPCSHAVCEACIPAIGERLTEDDERVIRILQCGLHSKPCEFTTPVEVLLLPNHVGRRIMTLDGGGVRGIVELATLAAIQERLGDKIPIQRFFDVIGGTSTGGIIGIALGIGDWTVKDAIQRFKNLCSLSFKTHSKYAAVQWWHQLFGDAACYQTKPLEQNIRSAFDPFGERPMIRAKGNDLRVSSPHVFVTTTVERGDTGAIATNYIRSDDSRTKDEEGIAYSIEVSNDPNHQLKVWEAARATSAAPSYFQPLEHCNGREYWDGGLFYNNPAKIAMAEFRRLWPESEAEHPDLLLSVGSGTSSMRQSSSTKITTIGKGLNTIGMTALNTLILVLKGRLEKNLNTEAAWLEDFVELETSVPRHYVRLNPKFVIELPGLDDVKSLTDGTLEQAAQNYLAAGDVARKLDIITRRLISTSFYFQPTRRPWQTETSELRISGSILCRFIQRSDTMRAFGEILDRFDSLQFLLTSPGQQGWTISEDVLTRMKHNGVFCFPIEFSLPAYATLFDIRLAAVNMAPESISASPIQLNTVYSFS